MSSATANATATLRHYLRTAYEAAGLPWGSDNDAEVGSIVDFLADEIERQIKAHRGDEPHSCLCGGAK